MTAPTPPSYSEWKHRAIIRVTNKVAVAGYQHTITINWKPGMRSDFRDIRFAQQDGKRCPYYISAYTARTSATVWIKVPSASQPTLLMFYGNGRAVSESSPSDVFIWFDSMTTDKSSGYTVQTGSGSSSWTYDTTNHWILLNNNTGILINATAGCTDIEVTCKIYLVAPGGDIYSGYIGVRGTTAISVGYRLKDDPGPSVGKSYALNRDSTSLASNTTVPPASAWHDVFLRAVGSSIAGRIGAAYTTLSATDSTYASGYVCFQKDVLSGDSMRITEIIVRKRASTEPTLAVTLHGINPRFRRPFGGVDLAAGTEYAFDSVNVDHGMSAGESGVEISMATQAVSQSMTPDGGAIEFDLAACGINHPIYPTASWATILNPVADTGEEVTVRVLRGMDDAMARADFEYETNAIGNYFSGDYLTQVIVSIPDYGGTTRVVFVGVCPSSRAVYSPSRDKMTMMAVDYGLYLTKQVLEKKDLSLLPPSVQDAEGTNIAKVLSVDNVAHMLQIGMEVAGQLGTASGTIFDIVQSTNGYILHLYPASGVFVDDEGLNVGGVLYAYCDGRSVDIPYTPYYAEVMPEDWVKSVLGGDNWMRVTGIEPFKITSTGGYWDTDLCPSVPFMFGSKESKWSAIQRVAKYLNYIFLIKSRDLGGGIYRASAYFVPIASIDDPSNGLDLPAAATLTYGSSGATDLYARLAAPVTLDQNGEQQADRVRVSCQTVKGEWLTSILQNSKVDNGEGPFLEFYDEPADICMQTDLDAYCADMYALYCARACTWSATILDRPDLELYQLINVSGFGVEIPTGIYRIVKISHDYGAAMNKTTITFMLSTEFSAHLRLGRAYTDSIIEVQKIAKRAAEEVAKTELATVTSTDGWTCTYDLESGASGRGRDSTSSPAAMGVIPVGSKVSVHSTPGGTVVIPIAADSDWGSGALVVDVPSITSAITDPDDHNYWYLDYVPGANNQNVSVNWQTGSYPPTHGSVTGSGSYTVLKPASVVRLRCRFSGPLTTYYIKLWGERGGRYSATGAQATITSGADVVPPDEEPGEPQEIGVIDELLCGGTDTDWTDAIQGPLVIFDGDLPFLYDGTSNIYIGGPIVCSLPLVERYGAEGPPPSGNAGHWHFPNQPAPRYFYTDDTLTIVTPLSTITLGGGWHAPQKILLQPGTNHVTITITDTAKYYRVCSDLYVRTYYL